ncbi:ORF E4 [human papillomavirus 47]|nr:ORF E4 [human papillomavirus 47]
MTKMKQMLICILCGHLCITWIQMMCGIRQQVGSIKLAFTTYMEHLNTIMCYLLMMQRDIVLLENGKLKLIRKLCLLLSLAPHHQGHQEDKQTQTPPPRPPPPPQPPLTPRPDANPSINSHNKPKPNEEGTDGDHQAEQGDRKRTKGDPDPDPGRGPVLKPTLPPPPPPPPTGPGLRRSTRLVLVPGQGPPPDLPAPPVEGEVEGHPQGKDRDHPPPTPQNGHGKETQGAEGGGDKGEQGAVGGESSDGEGDHSQPPLTPPNESDGSLLNTVACLLARWESNFDQLVQNIQGDLEGYWRKLGTPQ